MNYFDTFIEVADDCPAQTASVPAQKGGKKTIPVLQYEMIANHPYKYTQEDVLFETYADQNDIPAAERPAERHKFFTREQPCLRSSSLGKRYGWGIHSNINGKVALYAVESKDYKRLAGDATLKHVKALRSKRA
jgi:Family of unknown function (DUF6157)